MKNTAATITPRRTLLATLLAGLAASAFAAPSTTVVITQLYGAGGTAGAAYNKDFVELFNRSSEPVALGDLYLHYHSATGNGTSTGYRLPQKTLAPGEYFLVTGRSDGTVGADVTGDHALGNSLSMSGTAGRVTISTQSAGFGPGVLPSTWVDMLGYGGANVWETGTTSAPNGTGAAPAASATNSVQRIDQCIDTDNNRADFTAASAAGLAPRKMGTIAPVLCNGGGGGGGGGGGVPQPIVPSCPATLLAPGSAQLSATDKDSIVNGFSIVSAAVTGISLANPTPATADGGTGSVSLVADGSVAPGSYPVQVRFSNDDGENQSCTVNVSVSGTLKIPTIQGSGAKSAYAGTVQTTEGVVTARLGNSFFLQDPDGDNDASTSDGIYVFNSNANLVAGIAPGDRVRVSGTVTEYLPNGAASTYTELTNVSAVTKVGSGVTVTPANIDLPNTDFERYEGMLVRFNSALTVNQNKYLGDRGELTLGHGRNEAPTSRHPAGSADASALAARNAANEIVLDDNLFSTPPTIPYLGEDNTVRAGDTVTNLVGVLDYGSIGGGGAAFKLQPVEAPVFSRTNPREPAPTLPAGIKVASANVLNFFTTFTNGMDAWGRSGQGCTIGTSAPKASECRGADNNTEFVRQRNQIVASLKALDADVVGLMEIQNNGDVAVGYLVEQLNAAIGQPVYKVVEMASDAPASTPGTDAIRVAMIYKPAVLSAVGGPMFDSHSVNNRAPMAQTFKAANGAKFSVIVNHFKSKASCGGATGGNVELGNGQGCWDQLRVDQATRLTDVFVPQVTAAAGDPDVLVIGDLNAYQGERPIAHLVAKGFVNEIERFVRPNGMPYSYVFDGSAGYLDHALASASLSPQVAGAAEWHNNADEPEHIDYNLNDTPQDPYRENAYRASDHDPVVVSLALTPAFSDITSSVKIARSGYTMNRATGKYTGTVTITNTSGQALNGPFHFRLDGLTSGVTLDNRSGVQAGAPYVTLSGASLAVGASTTFTVVFNNPGKALINYTATLISGSF
jgi:predicted extracellular nuclease